jgi:hypothetical protein
MLDEMPTRMSAARSNEDGNTRLKRSVPRTSTTAAKRTAGDVPWYRYRDEVERKATRVPISQTKKYVAMERPTIKGIIKADKR